MCAHFPSHSLSALLSQRNPAVRPLRRCLLVLILLLVIVPIRSGLAASPSRSALQELPSVVLWAWERPEDFRFLRSSNTAVAFLAATLQLHDGQVAIRPRFQRLLVPDPVKLFAVVRIEVGPHTTLRNEQIAQCVAAIANAAAEPRVVAVQIDFDTTSSQRAFYRDLLIALRQRLGKNVPISITALASWCFDDDWISGLPIDEAVPMLFRMGAGANDVVSRVHSGRDFRSPLCRGSLGISTDERWPALFSGRRLYIFHPHPWTEAAAQEALWEVHSWR